MANIFANNQFHSGQYAYPHSQNSLEFHGFPNSRSQQPNADVIDGGIRTEQTGGFNGFRSNSSNSHTPRNEPDNRGIQPEAVARANDTLQDQYGIMQNKPKYQDFAVKARRLATYRNFPPEIIQTPEELAEAGFFFSGKNDVVYCFFCGQGLRAWEPEDDVWIEHARWSPQCVHLLNCKGREFVDLVQLAQTNPEIPMPSSRNSPDFVNIASPSTRGAAASNKQNGSSNQKDIDATKMLENFNSPLMQTVAAQSVIMNGYDREAVLKAINIYKLKENGRTDFNATELLKIVFELEDNTIDYDRLVAESVPPKEELKSEAKLPTPSPPQTIEQQAKKQQTSEMSETDQREAKSLLEENKHLKDQTLCKICLEEIVSIVFLPCGHLCSCSQCAPALRKCPICRGFIKGTVKTYLT